MDAANFDMAEMVRGLVTPLVTHPDELEVTRQDLNDGTIMIEMRVNEEDAGKVIGRQGRVIKAIRTVCRAAGSRHGVDVEVELLD